MKDINYVATDDPNVFTNQADPSVSYTLSDEQVALMNDSQLRLCCTHTLGSLEINTANMTVDGVIDNIAERDINFDGVIDASDEFHFFDLVATDAEDVWGLSLTETLASYLNFGYTEYAFADGQTLLDGWAALQPGGAGYLNFAGGDVIGTVSYAFDSGVVVAPVPLPAGLPLLLAGLGAMGFVRRRRNKANA
ncbi:VPLPA-CTERM sorting domain-containing protein [Pseudorhodobacter turbinis]|uniref:VPLPA-CTERM sorting domain-containing protein n=2 Tax=Pseudorhodobacter turbinis TaxID=2500533 RepID=A0A4V1E116_9RHOB|nr:VPLPA-CTERM sorting domain-containing protein [Pseudorhodobacter turbinis]